ncbi:MAG TPA: hypothetical protein VHP30_08405, partial [Ignavibacteriales bacterium]|nr:hypothetical protein [Ignavibacteriales bacterium]
QVVWRARGNSGQLRVAFLTLEPRRPAAFVDPPGLVATPILDEPQVEFSNTATEIRDLLARQGALSFPQILQQTGFTTVNAWQALEELLTREAVTNDSFGPVRYLLQTDSTDRVGARGVIKASVMAQWGRWALLSSPKMTAADRAYELLNRYGIVCREMAQAEGLAWQELYPVLDLWENLGRVQRGYFVSGLSGIQYALPEAVARLAAPGKRSALETPQYYMLSRFDPANPLRLFDQWLEEDASFKSWGDYLVWADGVPLLEIGGSKRLCLKTRPDLTNSEIVSALAAFLNTFHPAQAEAKLTITEWNGLNITEAPYQNALEALGFEKGYREMTLWPSRWKKLK